MHTALWTAVWAAAGVVSGKQLTHALGPAAALVAVVPLLALAFVFTAAAHEFGHVVAARQTGLRVLFVSAGPFGLARRKSRFCLMWVPYAMRLGGATIAVPAHDWPTTRQLLAYLAAGPAASALVGVALLLAANGMRHGAPPESVLLGGLGLLSLIAAATSALPYSLRHTTDGARALMVWRGGPRAERWRALLALHGLDVAGVRPRAWDSGLLATAAAPADGTVDELAACLRSYHSALDRQDAQAARSWLNRAQSVARRFPVRMRATVELETAFVAARYDRDAQRARAHFPPDKLARLAPVLVRLRAEATVLMAEGKHVAARVRARAMLALSEEAASGGEQAEADWAGAFLTNAVAGDERTLSALPLAQATPATKS